MCSEGLCCSSVIVKMGLHLRGEENPQLVSAVAGLCGGVHKGFLCGALTGGACMLSLFTEDAPELSAMTGELAEWFDSVYTEKYGSIDCRRITNGDHVLSCERCPGLIEATYMEAKSILADYGKI
jgi:C_GCAxxG_C_C family probable redox protein